MDPLTMMAISGGGKLLEGGINAWMGHRAEKRARRKHRKYIGAIEDEGLDDRIEMDYGQARGRALQMTSGARNAAVNNLGRQQSANSYRAMQNGVGLQSLNALNANASAKVHSSLGDMVGRMTQGVAGQQYQVDRQNQQARLNFLQQKMLGGPRKTPGLERVMQAVGPALNAGAQGYMQGMQMQDNSQGLQNTANYLSQNGYLRRGYGE